MQLTGIELRRTTGATNAKDFYRNVDKVLQESGNTNDLVISQGTKLQTIQHALTQMFAPSKYLNVCTIRECAEVAGIVLSKERDQVYRSIHCMSWNEMTPEYRMTIVALVLDDFREILNPMEVRAAVTAEYT